MTTLIRDLIRPYRGTLLVVLLAMLVETAMSLVGPWPLKIVIDNVIGEHKLPRALNEMLGPLDRGTSCALPGWPQRLSS